MTTAWIAAFVALTSMVVLLGLLVLGLVRRMTPLLDEAQELIASTSRRLTVGGLPPGATVPAFTAEVVGGGVFTREELRRQPSIVLFLDDGCGACEQLVADLKSGHRPDLDARLIVVSSARDVATRLAHSNHVTVLVDEPRSVARAFETVVSPHAFVVNEHGVALRNDTPNTWDGIRELVHEARGGGRNSSVSAAPIASSNAKEVI